MLIPWLDISDAQWGVLKINRAEIKQPGKARPVTFSIEQNKDVITAWPTKMALSPALADELIAMIKKDNVQASADMSLPLWPQIKYAEFPWNEEKCWSQS